MTLLRETPKDHGLLLDHDPQGKRRLSITLAGRTTTKRNGRRLQNAVGDHYDRCFQPASTVLWKMQGKRLQPQDVEAKQYYPISEEEAVQIRLLIDAVGHVESSKEAESLGRAIADMHPCESSWWYACARNRIRPKKVMDALSLMYG